MPVLIAWSQTGATGLSVQPLVVEAATPGLEASSFMRKVRVSSAVLTSSSRQRKTCVLPWTAQWIASGLTGRLGTVALLPVERGHRIAHVKRRSLQLLEVRHARAATESGRPVTSSSAPWTVNGVIGASGAIAAEPATADSNVETGPLSFRSKARALTVTTASRRASPAAKKLVPAIVFCMTGRNGQSAQPLLGQMDGANAYGMPSQRLKVAGLAMKASKISRFVVLQGVLATAFGVNGVAGATAPRAVEKALHSGKEYNWWRQPLEDSAQGVQYKPTSATMCHVLKTAHGMIGVIGLTVQSRVEAVPRGQRSPFEPSWAPSTEGRTASALTVTQRLAMLLVAAQ